MKLIRFGENGKERPGIEKTDGSKLDVSGFGEDYDEQFFGTDGVERLKVWLEKNEKQCSLINNEFRLGPPICRPSKIICVGLNYARHAAESGMDIPEEPVLFYKSTSSIIGPFDDVIIPKFSNKTDWEVELAFVISKKAKNVSKNDASQHIAGYLLHNDISERAFQLERGGQWMKGKSADTFAPLGPYLVTSDEIPNPHKLDLWLKVNGKEMQSSNTSDMVFQVNYLVSYISQFMTLLPGDVISTGTPFGVGMGLKPPAFLKEGDVMELGITGLGMARQHVKNYSPSI